MKLTASVAGIIQGVRGQRGYPRNCVPVIAPNNTDLYEKHMAVEYVYDVNGNIIEKKEGIAESVESTTIDVKRSVEFEYDPFYGRLTKKTYSDWTRQEYTYRPNDGLLDRVEVFKPGVTGPVYFRQFSYDALTWRVNGVTTPEGTIEYEHNDYGQLTRVKSLRGVDVTYLYDALGNLKVVKSKGFSENGDSNEIVAYSYNSIGRRTGITHPNGATVSYTHDYRGNIDTITHEKDATELLFLDYTRDGRGLVTDLLEKRNGESDVTWSYTYDAQKRLDGATRAVTGGGSTTYDYVYDDASNRTGKSVTGSDPITYTYNSLDQLISDGTTTYIYDEFGNLEYEKEGETTKRRYFWDGDNRLTKVELYNPNHTVVFGYDDSGTRISRKYDDDPTTRYLIDYQNLTGA